MGRKATLKKLDDIDFFIGIIGGPEIPTKQDKFKPLLASEYEIFIEEDGIKKKVVDDEMYLKKKTDKSLKEFEDNFRRTLREEISAEHPYKKDVPLEAICE